MQRVLYLLLALTVLQGAFPAQAAEQTPPLPTPAPAAADAREPTVVKMGAYISQLYDFDMPKRAFNVAIWVWAEHNNKDLKPLENIEIVNGKSHTTKFYSKQNINGTIWENQKYFTTIIKDWDTTNFPFDRQDLKIVLEDGVSDTGDIKYVADQKHSGYDKSMRVLGWMIKDFEIVAQEHKYDTNFGDPRVDEDSVYPRLKVTMTVERNGWRIFFSTFIGFFVSFFLAMLTHYVNFGALAASRVALASGAIFAATGNKYVIDNMLPPARSFSLSDTIQALTFFSIILSIITIILMQVYYKTDQPRADTLNKRLALLNAVLYVGGIGFALLRALA